VHLVSLDIIKNWKEGGVMQVLDDIYQDEKFHDNDSQRLKLKMNKRLKMIELLTIVRMKTKYPLSEISLYRMRFHRASSYSF